ncbi:MAG: hypothetical protein IH594_07015 [Bacteroidales bacterium]|nr:hypothetical protein [Bacteroidales bacterium]
MRNTFFILIISLFFATCSAQKKNQQTFSTVFYNVENLFDTVDDPLTMDEEFTPQSEKKWDAQKYRKKLDDLARVLSRIFADELPEVIGLAEVENRTVLEDLVNTSDLKKGGYQIIHADSPDQRGIDVALLYRKDELKDVYYETIQISFPFDSSETTRDILYVRGRAPDGKDLHVFVNHWSSRRDGMKESEPKRMYSAASLRRKIDLLLSQESDPRIIIMGDFNDEPTNRSVMSGLLAGNKRKNTGTGDLYNLFYDQHNLENKGTYYFRGTWNMLDQIMVSYNLVNVPGYYSCDYQDGAIFSEDWMMYENQDGLKVPNRTYGGPNYYGGVSDHWPIVVRFSID